MSKHIAYTFCVETMLPLSDDPQHPDFYTESVASSLTFRRDLERAMLTVLRRFEPEVTNLEIVEWTVEDDGAAHDAECGCDACRAERCRDTAEEPRHD